MTVCLLTAGPEQRPGRRMQDYWARYACAAVAWSCGISVPSLAGECICGAVGPRRDQGLGDGGVDARDLLSVAASAASTSIGTNTYCSQAVT